MTTRPTQWDWPGARWIRADLHLHTPASGDFKPRSDGTWAITPVQWVEKLEAAGVSLAAVTDHNTAEGIDRIQAAAKNTDLVILPGVEVSCVGGQVHILVLFPENTVHNTVTAFLGAVGLNNHSQHGYTDRSVPDVIDEATKLNAICIAAHADDEKGLLLQTGPGRQAVLKSGTLAAIELKHWEPKFLAHVNGSKPDFTPSRGPPPLIVSSDGHELPNLGSRTTWLKMTKPSLEGLRLALLDRELAVRPAEQIDVDPNTHASFVIESLSITNGYVAGNDGKPAETRFNPWMNAIIGGRGTGKSMLIDFLRETLRRRPELPLSLRGDYEKRMKVRQGRTNEGFLRDETRVALIVRKDGHRYRLQWDPHGKSEPIMIEKGGVFVADPGDIASRFRVRIYSQGQVYGLADDPGALLRIIDDDASVDAHGWQVECDELKNEYFALGAKQREIMGTVQHDERLKGELEDVKRKLSIFEAEGHAEVLRAYQRREWQARAAAEARRHHLDSTIEKLAGVIENTGLSQLHVGEIDAEDPADASLKAVYDRMYGESVALLDEVKKLIARGAKTAKEYEKALEASPWRAAHAAAATRYRELVEKLKVANVTHVEEYGRLVQRRQAIEEQLRANESRRLQAQSIESELLRLRRAILAHRQDLTARRARFLEQVNARAGSVLVEVLPFAAKGAAHVELRDILGLDGERFAKDIGLSGEGAGLLDRLYQGVDLDAKTPVNESEFAGRLESEKTNLVRLMNGDTDGVAVSDQRFAAAMKKLSPEARDRVALWSPPDLLRVRFRPDPTKPKQLQSIDTGSPGQKTAALLAFLLAYGDEPIILDQPEDDLDSRLIYDLLVKQLRDIKQRRQVIVVTHNANIVVNGDAELVISLSNRNGQVWCNAAGGLQEDRIRDEICSVMEGGTEAFDRRYHRIRRLES
jgi:DNA repair ATPase RecN